METEHVTVYLFCNFRPVIKIKKKKKETYILSHIKQGINANMTCFKN